MGERAITEDEVRATLEEPDIEYPGNAGRTVAERTTSGWSLATKVVYNLGGEREGSGYRRARASGQEVRA